MFLCSQFNLRNPDPRDDGNDDDGDSGEGDPDRMMVVMVIMM